VRRSAFHAVGGFDAVRFPRPQIEDIELGYRLRDAGGVIILDPSIQCTHLKRWTLRSMLRADFFERGVPWMRLLLEGRRVGRGSLNVTHTEMVKVGLMGAIVPLKLVWLVTGSAIALYAVVPCLLTVLWLNMPIHRFFARVRGPLFAIATVPLHLLHYALNAASVATAMTLYYGRKMQTALTPG
jgi:hypothetical protein